MDASLEAVVLQNRGFFTRGQALSCGWRDRDIVERLKSGAIVRLRHGAYCPLEIYAGLDDVGRHLMLARAVVSYQGRDRVALTGPSAAALYGFTLHGHDLGQVHLVRLDQGSSRRKTGAVHHRIGPALESELTERDGLLVISAARTVWEVATSSSLEGAVCAADSALRFDPALADELHRMAADYEHRPGSRTARLALLLADPRSESAGESVGRVKFYRYGIPRPELQHEVRDDRGVLIARTDFYWEEFCHTGEFDGFVKYEKYLRDGERASDVVFREKQREDQVRRQSLGMTRFIWREVGESAARNTTIQLRRDLETSRQLYTRNRVVIA